jgi:hypothetical protein
MKKTKKFLVIKIIFLLIMLGLSPGVFSVSTENIENDTILEMTPLTPTVYVGDMYVEGTGDPENSIVMAIAEDNLRIKIPLGGSDVIVEAKYLLQCPGLWDAGYAKLWVDRAEDQEVETTDYIEGYLRTRAFDCEIGDTIAWSVLAVYDDLFFQYPLTDYDAGGGIFTLKKSRGETSTPLIIEILMRFLDKCPFLENIASHFLDKIMMIKGTIICE